MTEIVDQVIYKRDYLATEEKHGAKAAIKELLLKMDAKRSKIVLRRTRKPKFPWSIVSSEVSVTGVCVGTEKKEKLCVLQAADPGEEFAYARLLKMLLNPSTSGEIQDQPDEGCRLYNGTPEDVKAGKCSRRVKVLNLAPRL